MKSLITVSLLLLSGSALAACGGNSVPEMDAALLPLSIMLLGGILAAGRERSRRKANSGK